MDDVRRLQPKKKAMATKLTRVTQSGGMGSWCCNTCGTDCRADGPGCEGSDYDFTPSYWPDDDGEYLLVTEADLETVIRNAIQYASDSTAWTSPLDGWQIDDIVEDALYDLGVTEHG